jgi:2,3-bisphosphoglycerate-independent phosphoglycerate mutase
MKRTVVLIILDGWGMGAQDEFNPIYAANPLNINYLRDNFPTGNLQASGISVGLPWGEEGNSEVGHLTIGAGKIIYQYFPKITMAIRNGHFFSNETLKAAFQHAQKNNSAVHLIGLLSAGNVHSSLEHLLALIKFASMEKINKLNLHLFTDGRDSPPFSAIELLQKIPNENIASISGRFYAMDRDNHWERTQRVYNVLTGNSKLISADQINQHIQKIYNQQLNDEYIEPILIKNKEVRYIQDNDAIIFFNFREDRMRQIVSPFVLPSFENFPIQQFKNLYIVTMTPYDPKFSIPAAYYPDSIINPLGKIIAENNLSQLRLAESQKYPHVTYFFNGLREEPFPNEFRILISSSASPRPEENPALMAPEITNRLLESLEEKIFNFILVNYANPDIIAHTGDYQACLKTVKIIDEQIGKITKSCLKNNAILIVTSDHGNIERVLNPKTGTAETQHDPNPVPIYLAAPELQRKKTGAEIIMAEKNNAGVLSDIAPTILELLGIPKPIDMTGQSLIKFLI